MTTKDRYKNIIAWFEEHVPVAETELHHDDPFQLLVAVILSAQCTDKRVNMVTPELFRVFPTAAKMAEAGADELFEYIRSISYPNAKAKHLAGMARMLADDFGVHGRSEFRVKSVDSVVCRKHRSFSGSEREANV